MAKSKTVLYYLESLARLKVVLGWTYEDVRQKLNQYLPGSEIPDSDSGRSQIERWMKPNRKGSVQPNAEIVLAIQSVIEIYDYLLTK